MKIRAFCFTLSLLLASSFSKATNILPSLPEPVTNNAVASVTVNDEQHIVSFMGLGAGKGINDVHNKVWKLVIKADGTNDGWKTMPSVPSSLKLKGRLASVAVGLDDKIYLFGGYTVATDHSEISAPDVYAFDVKTDSYTLLAPMPVPVDDAVALVYRDRYIYLISGWHNDGNVNLTQVYDTFKDEWFQASPFLGKPVFGHAGGIVDNQIMICDGVTTQAHMIQRRSFVAEAACYLGEINMIFPSKINWYSWVHPTDESRYRMAAAGDVENNRILFVGGSNNPYNYDGIGYNKKPSEPNNEIWSYYLDSRTWKVTTSESATMDHRGLLQVGDKWVTIGGMAENQKVLGDMTPHLKTTNPTATKDNADAISATASPSSN